MVQGWDGDSVELEIHASSLLLQTRFLLSASCPCTSGTKMTASALAIMSTFQPVGRGEEVMGADPLPKGMV